jgi:type VI secretion system protein ImpF
MSRINPDQLLLPSLLDRLVDFDPDKIQELPASRAQRLRDLKLSVRRDLEYLLNTRVALREMPEDCEQIKTSVLNYGIPDFSGIAMGTRKQQENLRRRVEEAIERYETRFKRVRVELILDSEDARQRLIRFRIDGVLHAEPAPEPVAFDSYLSPIASQFEVLPSDA